MRLYQNIPVLTVILCMTIELISGCAAQNNSSQSPTTSSVVPIQVVVQKSNAEPEKRIISEDITPQNNCSGSSVVSNEIERSYSLLRTAEIGAGITINSNGEIGVPNIGTVQVGSEIAASYGFSYAQEERITRKITVTAREGTNMGHKIQQVEYWQFGTVVIIASGQEIIRYPYRFRSDFNIELVEVVVMDCPSTPIPSIDITPTPIDIPTVLPTTIQPSNPSANVKLPPNLCGENAFAPGSMLTNEPVFLRPEGYSSGWISADASGLILPNGTADQISDRYVLIVHNLPELRLINVPIGNVYGCWYRSDVSIDQVTQEAERRNKDQQAEAPTILSVLYLVSSSKFKRLK